MDRHFRSTACGTADQHGTPTRKGVRRSRRVASGLDESDMHVTTPVGWRVKVASASATPGQAVRDSCRSGSSSMEPAGAGLPRVKPNRDRRVKPPHRRVSVRASFRATATHPTPPRRTAQGAEPTGAAAPDRRGRVAEPYASSRLSSPPRRSLEPPHDLEVRARLARRGPARPSHELVAIRGS